MTEEKKVPEVKPEEKKPEDLGWGCIGCLWTPIIIIGLILYFTGFFEDEDDYYDDDCNDSYIEQDYNGDGEEDAEDFRIQLDDC